MATPVANSVSLLAVDGGNGTLSDEFINGLVQGGSWTFGGGPRELTYSLDQNFDGASQNWPANWISAMDAAFAAWGAVADVSFALAGTPNAAIQNDSTADISVSLAPGEGGGVLLGLGVFPDPAFADDLLSTLGYSRDGGEFPYPRPEGDITFDSAHAVFSNLDAGGAGFYVLLHEIGHVLGLKHTDDDGGNSKLTFSELGIDAYESPRYTVMEGADFPSGAFPATPGLLDILAIQHIYGANTQYHAGDDAYVVSGAAFHAIWDAGGRDTFTAVDWAGAGGVEINLNEGAFSGDRLGEKRMAIAYGATIEDALGSDGADLLIGNGASNRLSGRAGDDTLQGGAGADRLVGGGGANELLGGAGNDMLAWHRLDVVIDGGAGTDTLRLAGGDLNLRTVEDTRIVDVERIDMRGGGANTLTLARADILAMSSSDTLKVFGDAGDTVELSGVFTALSDVGDFHRYKTGAAVLLVDADITNVT